MDATQAINDSILESDEEQDEEEAPNKRGRPLARLCILKNPHIPETELPLFLGDNVLGRDPSICTLPLPASSVSKQHATICISVFRRRDCRSEVDMEALVWDLGSMNGTRKGRLKLTPNVRYALSEGDSLVLADIPCQYVSCGADSVLSQDDMRTPGSRNSRVKAMLPDASGKKWGDTDTGSKKCVTGGEKAKTSVRGGCLSFEQTPAQPQGSLVPESDSDSDGGRDGGVNRRQKTRVSDSDSHKSSPTSSAFLSPPNKIVPESEDESSLTPSSSNGSNRHVSFSLEKPDVEKIKSLACVENSEEERTAQGGTNSKESVQHVKPKINASFTGEDGSLLSTPEVSRDALPEFNMDSDTDVEGEEEEVAPAGTLSLNTSQQADQPPNTVQFHMDSDTDLDEDEVISDKAPKTVPFSNDTTKPSSGIQPEGIIMDSDTDVDDDVSDAVTTAKASSLQAAPTADSASSAQPGDAHTDSDTDVDEEDEGGCGTKSKNSKTDETLIKSEVYPVVPESPAAPRGLHPNTDTSDAAVCSHAVADPSVASALTESCATRAAGADLDILSDSDTDVEDDSLLVIPLAVTNTSVVSGKTSGALKSDSDADTDVDEPCVPRAGDNPADLRVDSDTVAEDKEGDIGETGEDKIPHLSRGHTLGSLVPPLQKCSTPIQASGFSEGGVEDMETQAFTSPSSGALRRAEASPLKPAVLSSCSDSQADEDYAVAETQSFVLQTRDQQSGVDPNPSSVPASKPDDPSSRGDSFQLGLSDSNHLQCHGGALAMENTQYYASEERGVNLEETQQYEAISAADRAFTESDTNLEATQAYGEDEEPVRDSEKSEKEGCVNFAFEATQAYISEPCNDAEEDFDKEKRQNTAVTETTDPTGLLSTLAIAETQPMASFEEDESLETDNPICSAQHVVPRIKNKMMAKKAAQPRGKRITEAEAVAETQPMCTSDNEESDDEDLSKQRRLEEEQTQAYTCSALSLAETQPMHISADETQPLVLCEDDDEDSVPLAQKRKARQLHIVEEESQQVTNSDVHLAETQPIVASEDDDDEDSMPGPRKRKAKPLRLEDETQSQSQVNFEVQPSATGEGEQSDEEDTISCPRKRKARPLQLEEEQPLNRSEVSGVSTRPKARGEDDEKDSEVLVFPQKRKAKQLHLEDEETQPLTSSELSAAETQPACEDEKGDKMAGSQTRETKSPQHEKPLTSTEVSDVETQSNEGSKRPQDESISGPQKRLAKQHHLEEEMETLTNSTDCPGETPVKTKTEGTNKPSVSNSRQTRARRKEVEEKEECSAPPKRKTRKESPTLPTTRGRRGKATTHDYNSEEEVTQPQQTRGRKNTRLREGEKDKGKNVSDESLLKEQREGQLKEEMDTTELRQQEEEETKNDRMKTDERTREGEEREQRRLQVNDTEVEKVESEEKNQLGGRKRNKLDESLVLAKREQEERLDREKKERERQKQLEKEEREKLGKGKEAKEKQVKVPQKNKDEEEKLKAPAGGRRATRQTAQCATEQEQNASVPTSEDFPARRTRSRSNSSNSVSSERSASGVSTRESNARGRGRGAKRSSETLQTTAVRSSRRRTTTVAAGLTERDRSNSSSSISSAISSCSGISQNRGRGRKTRSDCHVVVPDVSDQNSTVKGRKSGKMVESSEVQHKNDTEKEETWRAATNRGQQQVDANKAEPAVSNDEGQSGRGKGPSSKRNVRVRGQKVEKTENVDEPVAPSSSDGDEARSKRKGRRSELEMNTKASGANVSTGKNRVQKTTEEGGKSEQKEKIPTTVQARRTSRASSSQVKKNVQESLPEEEVEAAEKKTRWTSVVQSNKEEEPKEQDANMKASEEPQTPTSCAHRKRRAPSDSSPLAKTPRSSSCSPAASVRPRAGSQAYKVLFTGVMDEEGERVLASLGGSMAKGVADMNCLVTDKVRRTVKFLCAVAKGVPVVTTDWLEKSGKAGSFLSPNAFIVKDPEQEKKFSFCLQESLRTARSQPLLQGYEIHVTKSVKPEPVHMRDIISCSGATFLPKMPSSHKAQTVVISCEEDRRLCGPAASASLPVVTSEFILTGILQQKVDFQTHALSSTPPSNPQPAGDRGRSRRKT